MSKPDNLRSADCCGNCKHGGDNHGQRVYCTLFECETDECDICDKFWKESDK